MNPSSHLEMGSGAEFDAVRRLLATWGARATGIGDDAAVLEIPVGERLVVSTDASVEDVHFRRAWITDEEIGGRAAAAALSDLAAMAATPRGLLLALGLPDSWRGSLESLARGVGDVSAAAECPIVGGNVTVSRDLVLTITVLGSAAQPLTRAGCRSGDTIFVTGLFGGPGAALRAWKAGESPTAAQRARFASPTPRLREARWLAQRGARAAIDISDGLYADASHLALASGVSLALNEGAVPRLPGVSVEHALSSGEEYELLVAAPPGSAIRPHEFQREFGLPLTAVGAAVVRGANVVTLSGSDAALLRGHDHLK